MQRVRKMLKVLWVQRSQRRCRLRGSRGFRGITDSRGGFEGLKGCSHGL
jgi:hypothetical protein